HAVGVVGARPFAKVHALPRRRYRRCRTGPAELALRASGTTLALRASGTTLALRASGTTLALPVSGAAGWNRARGDRGLKYGLVVLHERGSRGRRGPAGLEPGDVDLRWHQPRDPQVMRAGRDRMRQRRAVEHGT